jgi:hypothetical protein
MDKLALSKLAAEIIAKFGIVRNIPYTVGNDSNLSAEDALVQMIGAAANPVKLDRTPKVTWESWCEGGGN